MADVRSDVESLALKIKYPAVGRHFRLQGIDLPVQGSAGPSICQCTRAAVPARSGICRPNDRSCHSFHGLPICHAPPIHLTLNFVVMLAVTGYFRPAVNLRHSPNLLHLDCFLSGHVAATIGPLGPGINNYLDGAESCFWCTKLHHLQSRASTDNDGYYDMAFRLHHPLAPEMRLTKS